MRVDLMFEPLYVLSALWGILPSSQVCSTDSPSGLQATSGARRAPAEVTAFVAVNVVPMDTERVLLNQTVLVKEGRILALGPVNKVPVPTGAVRIDGRGKYLIPGLGDMHVHGLNLLSNDRRDPVPFLFNQLAGGVTAVRYLSVVSDNGLQALRAPKAASEKPLPYIYLSGDVKKLAQPGLAPDSMIAAYKAAGYNFIFLLTSDSLPHRENGRSLLAAGQRLGIPPATHQHEASIEALGAYGGSIEHVYSFLENKLLYSIRDGTADRSPSEIQARAEAARRAGVWITPTLACHEYLAHFGPRVLELRRQMVKALSDAGVGLLLGAEGAYAADELAAQVRAGLTPYQAIATGTRNVAQYFSVLDSRGTIAVGKRADLVLLSGNPLADIEHVREPAGVMLEGRWLDRVALDQLLLAAPKAWFRETWVSAYDEDPKLGVHVKKFEELTDSLSAAPPSESARLLSLLAEELAALHRQLGETWESHSPQLQKNFDVIVRAWIREQARRGHRVAVIGVASSP